MKLHSTLVPSLPAVVLFMRPIVVDHHMNLLVHTSASASFNTQIICSSVNRFFRIVSSAFGSYIPENSHFNCSSSWRAGHPELIRLNLHSPYPASEQKIGDYKRRQQADHQELNTVQYAFVGKRQLSKIAGSGCCIPSRTDPPLYCN